MAVFPGTIRLGKLGEKPIPKAVLLELAYEVIARFQGSLLSGAVRRGWTSYVVSQGFTPIPTVLPPSAGGARAGDL